MVVTIENHSVVSIVREKGSPRIDRESTFWHYLSRAMRDKGFDVVRQVPGEDGHLTAMPYYLKYQKTGEPAVADLNYAIRIPTEDYNAYRPVSLQFYRGRDCPSDLAHC